MNLKLLFKCYKDLDINPFFFFYFKSQIPSQINFFLVVSIGFHKIQIDPYDYQNIVN